MFLHSLSQSVFHQLFNEGGDGGGALNGSGGGGVAAPVAPTSAAPTTPAAPGTTPAPFVPKEQIFSGQEPSLRNEIARMNEGKSPEEIMFGKPEAPASPAAPAAAAAPVVPAAPKVEAPAPPMVSDGPQSQQQVADYLMKSPDPKIRAQGLRMAAELADPSQPSQPSAPAAPAAPAGPTREQIVAKIQKDVEDSMIQGRRIPQTDAQGLPLIDPDTNERLFEPMDEARARLRKDPNFKELVALKQERAIEKHDREAQVQQSRVSEARHFEQFIETTTNAGVLLAVHEAIPAARLEGGKVNEAVVAAVRPIYEAAVIKNMRQFSDTDLAEALPSLSPRMRQEKLVEWANLKAGEELKALYGVTATLAPPATAPAVVPAAATPGAPSAQVIQVQPPAAAPNAAIPPAIGPTSGASPFTPQTPEQVNARKSFDHVPAEQMSQHVSRAGGMAAAILPRHGMQAAAASDE